MVRTVRPSSASVDMKTENAKENAILRTAAGLFFREGYHTGIDRIIPESNVAKMTFYKYFPSKAKLLVAVIEDAHRKLLRRLQELEIALETKGLPLTGNSFDPVLKAMTEEGVWGALVSRAVVELEGCEANPHRVAVKCELELFKAIHRICLKAGTGDRAVARQIHLLIVGGNVLRLAYKEGETRNAIKDGIGKLLPVSSKGHSAKGLWRGQEVRIERRPYRSAD